MRWSGLFLDVPPASASHTLQLDESGTCRGTFVTPSCSLLQSCSTWPQASGNPKRLNHERDPSASWRRSMQHGLVWPRSIQPPSGGRGGLVSLSANPFRAVRAILARRMEARSHILGSHQWKRPSLHWEHECPLLRNVLGDHSQKKPSRSLRNVTGRCRLCTNFSLPCHRTWAHGCTRTSRCCVNIIAEGGPYHGWPS